MNQNPEVGPIWRDIRMDYFSSNLQKCKLTGKLGRDDISILFCFPEPFLRGSPKISQFQSLMFGGPIFAKAKGTYNL